MSRAFSGNVGTGVPPENAPKRKASALLGDEQGAVAVTYALALTGLIVIAGVAFDFARMAGLSSELHNAADQAALAAATQLDGSANAIADATTAASNLVANKTVLANEPGGSPAITIAGLTFYSSYDPSTGTGITTTDPTQANFVRVAVNAREAYYAYTAIAGLFSSGAISAAATAGLGSSICKVPPVFMCNPAGSGDFNVSSYIGKGLALIGNTGGNYTPGNFGWLQSSAGPGASQLRQEIGQLVPAVDCQPATGVTTEPGQDTSVLDAVNTRMDIYASTMNSSCGSGTASCPSSANSRTDLVNARPPKKCAIQNKGWQLPATPYAAPSKTTPMTNAQAAALSPMGYPPDMCHSYNDASGCTSISGTSFIGDGNWDRNAYFTSNRASSYPTYPSSGTVGQQAAWMSSVYGTSTPTRYQVYRNDAANAATRLVSQQDGTTGNYSFPTPAPACDASGGVPVGGGTVSGQSVADRRVISVAVLDCRGGIAGKTTDVQVVRWVDVLLVQPTNISRPNGDGSTSNSKDVYVEVVGETAVGGGSATPQVVRISKPYLVN